MMLRRLPMDSAQPVVIFAAARLALAATGFLAALVLSFEGSGDTALALGAGFLPWSAAVLVLALRRPAAAMNPLLALGDLAALVAVELAAPQASLAIQSAAVFLIAAHSHLQGEGRGPVLALTWAGVLVLVSALRGDAGLDSDKVAFHDAVFVLAALSTGLVVGRLRTLESASRMRARELSGRATRSEAEVRRRVAEAIHDGPVQELIGLDMVLSTMGSELERSNPARAAELLADARLIAARNIEVLRDEMVDLGPHGLDQVTLEVAIETCVPTWNRRYAVDVEVDVDPVKLAPEVAGELFRIAQEGASNAGRHSRGNRVAISLRRTAGGVELTVADNGSGFGGFDPRSDSEPRHLGLASMRERAELLGGTFEIRSSENGATIVTRVPIETQGERRRAFGRLRADRRRRPNQL